jgi:hypothetical protein
MTVLYPLQVIFYNNSLQAPSEVSISLPNTVVNSFVIVAWGDGTSSKVYGGVGNRIAHSYGNPSQRAGYTVSVTGDASTVSFYDASGDRATGQMVGWGSYNVSKVIMPNNTIVTTPIS